MSKSGGGCSSKGGGGKSRGSTSTSVVKTSTKMTTSQDHVGTLRASLFDDDGGDRNVLLGFEAFQKYDRNGLDATIAFFTGKTFPRKQRDWAFELVKVSMEESYDVSGYGWDDEDKRDELFSAASRWLLVRGAEGEPLGFAQFRFTLQGEFLQRMEGAPCLFLYDLCMMEDARGKGLGKRLLQLLELIARKVCMSYLCTFVPNTPECRRAESFFLTKLKGYQVNNKYCARFDEEEDPSVNMIDKCLDSGILKRQAEAAEVQALAQQLSTLMGNTAAPAAEPVAAPVVSEPVSERAAAEPVVSEPVVSDDPVASA